MSYNVFNKAVMVSIRLARLHVLRGIRRDCSTGFGGVVISIVSITFDVVAVDVMGRRRWTGDRVVGSPLVRTVPGGAVLLRSAGESD